MKVILNKCFGGFELSKKAHQLYAEKKGLPFNIYFDKYGFEQYRTDGKTEGEPDSKDFFWLSDKYRDDPVLVEVVEELGEAANGCCANLLVVDIPDGMDYVVNDYDGIEILSPKTQTW